MFLRQNQTEIKLSLDLCVIYLFKDRARKYCSVGDVFIVLLEMCYIVRAFAAKK